MGSEYPPERIAAALFGKTRRCVLALLFGRPDESFYLREVARVARFWPALLVVAGVWLLKKHQEKAE